MSGSMIRALAGENASQRRGLTGQGEPGLHTLLGGTGEEADASTYRVGGGAAQASLVVKLARAHKDVRLAAQLTGTAATPADSDYNDGRGTIPDPGHVRN